VREVSAVEESECTVRRLAQQAAGLTLIEQVQLLQCLAACIEQQVGAPLVAVPAVQTPARTEGEQPSAPVTQPRPATSPVLDAITYRIIGCAQAVHRRLGKGLREDSYQRALETEFLHVGLACRPQQKIAVYDSLQYRVSGDGSSGHLLGYYIPDFVIEDQVIVEIKALSATDASHIAQVIAYLAVSGCRVGLLINFAERSLHPRRILPPADLQHHQVSTQWLWTPFHNS